MKFKGSPEFQEFWSYLEDESPRGTAIVVAAHFDEKLGDLLGQVQPHSFYSRINDAHATGLLTQNEHDDLHVFRALRNSFAHNLKARDFDASKSSQVDFLKTWQIAVGKLPQYAEFFPSSKERLLYVAAMFSAWFE